MDKKHIAETWLFYGISDLYFSFHTDEIVFDYHSAFSAIMALEKHLKAFILFNRGNEFESLQDGKAMKKVQAIARECGHNFPEMLSTCETYISTGAINKLLSTDYDGYNGKELSEILKDSYMETRYPTNIQVSSKFPVGDVGIYHNPLSSSGLHKFILTVCEYILNELIPFINKDKLLQNVTDQYKHLEPFNRFKNIYMKSKWA
jgi:hypothetical protein